MKPHYPNADRSTVFEEGLEFQDHVAEMLYAELGITIMNYSSRHYQFEYGENRQGMEIKLDKRIIETGNVSIEVAEKSKAANSEWIASGIMRVDDSWLYIQGNYDIIFIFGKVPLQQLYNNKYKDKVWEPKPTIRTFLMTIEDAKKHALKILH